MKIIDVECLIVDKLYPYVVIQTDEGITGFGECFRRAPFVTKAAIETVYKDILIGRSLEISIFGINCLTHQVLLAPMEVCLLQYLESILHLGYKAKRKKSSLSEEFGGKRKTLILCKLNEKRYGANGGSGKAQFFYEKGFKYYKMHSAFPEEIDSPNDKTL